MGGVAVDDAGRTSLEGLWAAGEAASSGVHGANRLASNSLLEGLVFGATVADAITEATRPVGEGDLEIADHADALAIEAHPAIERDIRERMWANVGVVRDAAGLERALAQFEALAPGASTHLIARNMLDVGRLVAAAALARTESRGAHYRADHPDPDPAQAHRTFVTPPTAPAVQIRQAVVAGGGTR
jgi:L-aspartate oxidase